MSGGPKGAKQPLERPLDGGVGPLAHWDGELSGDVCSGIRCVLCSLALCGACSSSVTTRRRTDSSSISSRPIRARPTANRPMASVPTAIAPTAIAPSANPPTASAQVANARRACRAAPIVSMRCKVWLGQRALDIAMKRYSQFAAHPRAGLEGPNVCVQRLPKAVRWNTGLGPCCAETRLTQTP